jgi:hypothetical protein
MKVSKWLKIAFLAALSIGAGYFFGTVCGRIGHASELILAPSGELLTLLAWFLLAVGTVAVTAGLVAALVRPVWGGFIAFALSGLAMLLGWQVAAVNGALVLVYAVAACAYAGGVARELNERTEFSVRPVSASQGMLRMTLTLVACGSLYVGYAAHVEREGFSLPEVYVEAFVNQMERQIEAQVSAEEREEAVRGFREGFRSTIDEFIERRVKPHEELIPLGVAAGLFMPLLTTTTLLAWVPTVILSLAFRLLTAWGVTKVVSETREVKRLVID